MFNALWNLSIGIVGGIISSVIVSRIFLIQSDLQGQLNTFELVIRRLGYLDGILESVRYVQEFSYDSETKKQKEMETKGYKTEQEYYLAHTDIRWIDADALVEKMTKDCKSRGKEYYNDLFLARITEHELSDIFDRIMEYVRGIYTTKELSFAVLNEFKAQSEKIVQDYDQYCKNAKKKLISLIVTDKYLLILFAGILTIVVLTVLAFIFKW